MEKEKKEEKKSFKTKVVDLFIFLILIVVCIFLYSKYIGTKGLIVKEKRIVSEKIPSNFSGAKIIYFSDLLMYSTVNNDDLDNLVENINMYKPDIVIFGGNLISKNHKLKDKEKEVLIEKLINIESNLGKYAVLGSIDDEEKITEILTSSNFTILDNKIDFIYRDEGSPICLKGISSYILSKYEFSETDECNGLYQILFTHEPDIIDSILEKYSPDLILSGNSLGGEIYLPFYGPIEKFEGSKKYYNDYYKMGDADFYISSGLGTKKLNKRLFNKPSIYLFRIKSN